MRLNAIVLVSLVLGLYSSAEASSQQLDLPPLNCTFSEYQKFFPGKFTARGNLVTYFEKFDKFIENNGNPCEFLTQHPDIAEDLRTKEIASDFRSFLPPKKTEEGHSEFWTTTLKKNASGDSETLESVQIIFKKEKKTKKSFIFDLRNPFARKPKETVETVSETKLSQVDIEVQNHTSSIKYVWGLYTEDGVNMSTSWEWGTTASAMSHTKIVREGL